MTLTLRIKKHWLEEIASGRKRTEYRLVKPFYDKTIWSKRREIKKLKLHYQQSRRIVVEVTKIRRERCDQGHWYALDLGSILHQEY